jgi:hypothetical protein
MECQSCGNVVALGAFALDAPLCVWCYEDTKRAQYDEPENPADKYWPEGSFVEKRD